MKNLKMQGMISWSLWEALEGSGEPDRFPMPSDASNLFPASNKAPRGSNGMFW